MERRTRSMETKISSKAQKTHYWATKTKSKENLIELVEIKIKLKDQKIS